MSEKPLVRFDIEDGIGVITIDNPPVNALGPGVREGIIESVEKGNADPNVGAMVLIGAGRSFIAGADIRQFGKPRPQPTRRSTDVLDESAKPVVAAIHGYALGGGLEHALSCNYRIAVPSAKVGLPEVLIGVLPGGGGTQRLPRLIPLSLAYEHLLLGTPIDAATALRIGFVNHVCPRADLMDHALDLATRIARRGPVAIRYTMEAVRSGLMAPLEVGMRLERAFASLVNDSAEARAGMEQFFGSGRRPVAQTAKRAASPRSRRRP